MSVVTIASEEARNRWGDMMDAAFTGGQVMIKRHNKLQAVLVSYSQWEKMQQRLLVLEGWATARRISDEMNAHPKKVVSFAEHKRKMEAKGMVYELGDRVQRGS